MSEDGAILIVVCLAPTAVASCQAYQYREEGLTERAAIAAGYCRDKNWDQWKPCTTPKPEASR